MPASAEGVLVGSGALALALALAGGSVKAGRLGLRKGCSSQGK